MKAVQFVVSSCGKALGSVFLCRDCGSLFLWEGFCSTTTYGGEPQEVRQVSQTVWTWMCWPRWVYIGFNGGFVCGLPSATWSWHSRKRHLCTLEPPCSRTRTAPKGRERQNCKWLHSKTKNWIKLNNKQQYFCWSLYIQYRLLYQPNTQLFWYNLDNSPVK